MARSYLKLVWPIFGESLTKSVLLDSAKALFMVEKVTDFRNAMSIIRQMYYATLREMALPWVKYSNENNLELSETNFNTWRSNCVQSETYNAVYEIQKNYGTSIILFYSGMRSNNYQVMSAANQVFSPLLHLNNNVNYAIMDVQTRYQDLTMKLKAPEQYEYLEVRRCNNKTNVPYRFEPLDERHEGKGSLKKQLEKLEAAKAA